MRRFLFLLCLAGILLLVHYLLAGVIWYQGESNAHNYSAHEKLFGLLASTFRASVWGLEDK